MDIPGLVSSLLVYPLVATDCMISVGCNFPSDKFLRRDLGLSYPATEPPVTWMLGNVLMEELLACM